MSERHDNERTERLRVSRRRFLAAGVTAASCSAIALTRQSAWAAPGRAGAVGPAIDPGYFASQFYDAREEEAVQDVIRTGSPFRYWGPANPKRVKTFEVEYAKYMGTKYALAVTSGTAALDCAVAALEIGPGDEVIVPAYTWWSDYTCVVHAGALPVFAEIDRSLCLDPEDFARKITPRTKAVIAVHLLGGFCDMDPIMETARKKNIAVLEDAAQCVGGSYRGKKLGALGDIGIYSFQLNKMISSGEGGAVVTNDPLKYERAARFHDMGGLRSPFRERLGKSQVAEFAGENFRMSEFTGAVLGAQLPKLDLMREGLQRAALAVYDGIQDLPGIRLRKRPDPKGDIGYGVYFEMPSKEKRNRCIAELSKRRIPAGTLSGSVMLPAESAVINKQTRHPNWPSFTSPEGRAIRYGAETCPQSIEVFDRFVQVRMGPKYTQEMIDRIIAAIREVYPTVS
jgi:8-amino-3,8-dideoxy-alpha-D-manno-octulosonate transaminase